MYLKGSSIHLAILVLLFSNSIIFSQDNNYPVRSRWVSPDNSKPMSYSEWKSNLPDISIEIEPQQKYLSKEGLSSLRQVVYDSDYAYIRGIIRHSDNSKCCHLYPDVSFIVYLNEDTSKILTDKAPRWTDGDPNINGDGMYGLELGNFINPEIAVGDSYKVVFTCYVSGEQGKVTNTITALPWVSFPDNMNLIPNDVPLPPDSITVEKEDENRIIKWKKEDNLTYIVYRRNLADLIEGAIYRYQYEKIAENINDSTFTDTTTLLEENYGYILFAKNDSGIISGHSEDVKDFIPVTDRAIFIEPELYDYIETPILQMVTDWENEGATVAVYSGTYNNAEDLRDSLASIYGLKGALLIGDFPVKWYQTTYYDEENSEWHYQEFPIDLYYMDLDGNWYDNKEKNIDGELVPGSDGIYDGHTATFPQSEAPEIVVGRISPKGMGNRVNIIYNYLHKCHNYRYDIETIRQEFKSLAFVDDDWAGWGADICNDNMSKVYSQNVLVNDIEETNATDYGGRLDDNYSLVHLYCHSYHEGHSFRINNGTESDWFFNTDILPANTNANFYMLWACGNSRYVEDNYCGGVYALKTISGINSIGTTHSGGMTDFVYFYDRLAEGVAYGEAFLLTFQYAGEGGFDEGQKGWYYGLTFNGDPFIIPQPSNVTAIAQEHFNHIPEQISLENYPNPFNPATTISYSLPASGKVELTIYNMLGQKIRSLIHMYQFAGQHKIIWDGKNAQGIKMPSGIYIYRLRSGKSMISKKMILIK